MAKKKAAKAKGVSRQRGVSTRMIRQAAAGKKVTGSSGSGG